VRQQLHFLKRVRITPDAMFLGCAAVDEVETKTRNAPSRPAAQVIDGRKILPQPCPRRVFAHRLFGWRSIDHVLSVSSAFRHDSR
jgi:hypothetical protein